MRKPIGLALAACVALFGCNQPPTDDAGGGGGKVATTPVTDVQRARNRLGEAYVHAARTHADVVRGNFDGAIGAIRDVRAELTEAKRTARLDTQVRINEMDQMAIRVQREIERRSLTSYQATEKFVGGMQGLLASMPPQAIDGGGGGASAPEAQPPIRHAPAEAEPPESLAPAPTRP